MTLSIKAAFFAVCAIGIGFRLLMTLIPARHIYSIRDDELRPTHFNSATAFHAPEHVLSPLGRKLKALSNIGLMMAALLLAIGAAFEWMS